MATAAARDSFFEAGLQILADLGFGGLKLAEVCKRLGVSTGSFYHYFTNWNSYARGLVGYWKQDHTDRLSELFSRQSDPRKRMQLIIQSVLSLPHSAEAAIRAWSSIDPAVHAVQVEVDRQRFQVCYDYAIEIVGDPRQAEVFADHAVYVLVGYEQATLERDPATYKWISGQLVNMLENGGFADVPPRPSAPAV